MPAQGVQELWEQTLNLLSRQLSRPSFETWIQAVQPLALHGKTLYLGVPHEFARDWLQEHYAGLIKSAVRAVSHLPLEIQLVLPPDLQQRAPAAEGLSLPLNPKYTFETFVVGNSNRFAHAASLAVAENPSRAYNPLFIYGGVGLGKTHLMHAIGHHVLARMPTCRVVYVSCEHFTNELINAIRDDKTEEFRGKYRHIDVLLVDDVQFLAGKERTQEEFFHTFNALHEANRQIILSSDRPPREIPTLEDRLRSRFEWGLLTDIQPPDLETRIAILEKKAEMEGASLLPEVMFYIASQFQANIRELEGALIRVAAYAAFYRRPVDVETAATILADMLPQKKQPKITIPLIQKVVASYFNLRPEDLRAKKRNRTVALPRQIAMYLCRELADSSLTRIGEAFGGRDHTTVIHACDKIARDLKHDPSLQKTVRELTEQLHAY
ncbi:MAG: chromosomal replication initiator protein DnaA [Clostridia bacterium]|nr:chromosomal replication initiator protein DnaA [Clostridia bacterium]